MTRWRIRPAATDDAATIVALERESFGPASWGAKAVADGIAERHVATIVALAPDAAAPDGFAFWRNAGEEAEILSIGVANASRRQGCARALLDAIISRARLEGVRRLFLEVDVANISASSLYRARGFEQVGRRRRYYRNGGDALVMRLDL